MISLDIYPLGRGEYLAADLAHANQSIAIGVLCRDQCDDDENCGCNRERLGNGREVRISWTRTPFQTADARHTLSHAKKLARDWVRGL